MPLKLLIRHIRNDLLKLKVPRLPNKNACRASPEIMARFIPYLYFSVVFDKVFYYPNAKKLFARPSMIMPQYGTSSITAVMLAYHAGFKNIVVHGIDFTGPHIYHDQDLQGQTFGGKHNILPVSNFVVILMRILFSKP